MRNIYKVILSIVLFILFLLIISQIEASTKINFHEIIHPKYYKLPTINYKNPKMNIKKGKQIAQTSTIAICGLARNVSRVLNKTKIRLEYIGKQFKDYRIIIFENDSNDGSRKLLSDWTKENNKVILLDCCELGSCDCLLKKKEGYSLGAFSKSRIDNMAFYRNQCLKAAKKTNFDYLMVTDIDLNGQTNINGIYDSLSYDNWDAIFCNGQVGIFGTFGTLTIQYDAVAYVDINGEFDEKTNHLIKCVKNYSKMKYNVINNYSLVPVKSAFNGYGLYKLKSLKNISYYGHPLICEHNSLAKQIIENGGKNYINPNWIGYFDLQGPGGLYEILKSANKG